MNNDIYKEESAYELQSCFANAVEACETLLTKARELQALAQNEQWQSMLEVLKQAKGYGYFDDDFYRQLIQKHIDQYGEA